MNGVARERLNSEPIGADLVRLMLPLLFDDVSLRGRPTVLALGSHSDDIELGAGGTILHLA